MSIGLSAGSPPALWDVCYNVYMTTEADPYRVLGVSRDAGLDEVRQAYRRAALRYHPDSRPADPADAERTFHAVCEAYRTILGTFGPGAVAGEGLDPNRTYTPAELARRAGGWRHDWPGGGRRGDRARRWWPWPVTQKVTLARVNETRVFVWFWAVALVVGVVVACFADQWGLVGQMPATPGIGDLLGMILMGIGVYLGVLAGTVAAIIMTRQIVAVTLQLGLRLLPAPFRPKRQRKLPPHP